MANAYIVFFSVFIHSNTKGSKEVHQKSIAPFPLTSSFAKVIDLALRDQFTHSSAIAKNNNNNQINK